MLVVSARGGGKKKYQYGGSGIFAGLTKNIFQKSFKNDISTVGHWSKDCRCCRERSYFCYKESCRRYCQHCYQQSQVIHNAKGIKT